MCAVTFALNGASKGAQRRLRASVFERDEDQACGAPSGPGAPSPDSQAEYTHAIRPCYQTFFEAALACGGSPYTLLAGSFLQRAHCNEVFVTNLPKIFGVQRE